MCVRLEDGRLLDYLVACDELMEEKVAFFIRETLEALQHLHTCRVTHLDLKVRVCATSMKTNFTYQWSKFLICFYLCFGNVIDYLVELYDTFASIVSLGCSCNCCRGPA